MEQLTPFNTSLLLANESHLPWGSISGITKDDLKRVQNDIRGIFVLTYLLTFAFGVLGNGLVVYIIGYCHDVRRKSVANYYIWNLSFADLFFVMTLPLFCYTTLTGDWPFTGIVCKLATAIRETNKFTSVFTLVALAVDRYLASFYNMGHFRTVRVGKFVLVVVWVSAMLLSTPYWLYSHTRTSRFSEKTTCRFQFIQLQEFWIYFQLCVGLVIPFCVIVSCYCGLVVRMRYILKSGTQGRRNKFQKPSRRMTKTVLVVVLTFLCCQAPYHIMQIMNLRQTKKFSAVRSPAVLTNTTLAPEPAQAASPSLESIRTYLILNAISQMLVFISSCCNPIIYGVLNENYRQLYIAVCCKCCSRQTITFSGATSTSNNQLNPQQSTYRFHKGQQVNASSTGSSRKKPRGGHSPQPSRPTEEMELA